MPWPIGSMDVFDLFRRGARVSLEDIATIAPLQATVALLQADVLALQAALAAKLGKLILHVEDVKNNNVNGGDSAAGTNIRVLNTVRTNTIVGASLAANRVTLPAGTFRIIADAPAYIANSHKVYLYNVTDAAVALIGRNAYSATTDTTSTHSALFGVLTIVAPKVFELRHFINTARVSNGLGVLTNAAMSEIYARLWAIKE